MAFQVYVIIRVPNYWIPPNDKNPLQGLLFGGVINRKKGLSDLPALRCFEGKEKYLHACYFASFLILHGLSDSMCHRSKEKTTPRYAELYKSSPWKHSNLLYVQSARKRQGTTSFCFTIFIHFHRCASAAGQVEDGLFDYELRCTVASGEPVKGLELPALHLGDQAATGPALNREACGHGPSSLREAGNNCCSELLKSGRKGRIWEF